MKKHFTMRKLLCFTLSLAMVASPFSYGQLNGETILFAQTKQISLNAEKLTLRIGNRFVLKVKGAETKPTWISDSPKVVKISKKGVVIAKKAGQAVITVNVGKKVLYCSVKVGKQLSEKQVKKSLLRMKKHYPEGMKWADEDSYYSRSASTIGYGCAGFAFLMSDAAFGKKRTFTKVSDLSNIRKKLRIGDILRINNNSHSVIVIGKTDDGVITAEGNYNRSIHWGEHLTYDEIESNGNYYMTRY